MRHFFKPKFINYYADSTHIRVSRGVPATLLANRLKPKARWKISYAQAFRKVC
jgi:hypothetical protein